MNNSNPNTHAHRHEVWLSVWREKISKILDALRKPLANTRKQKKKPRIHTVTWTVLTIEDFLMVSIHFFQQNHTHIEQQQSKESCGTHIYYAQCTHTDITEQRAMSACASAHSPSVLRESFNLHTWNLIHTYVIFFCFFVLLPLLMPLIMPMSIRLSSLEKIQNGMYELSVSHFFVCVDHNSFIRTIWFSRRCLEFGLGYSVLRFCTAAAT